MKLLDWMLRRPAKAAARNYEAAKPSRIAAGFNIFGGSRSANEDIRWDLRGLIAHSRKQAQNNDYLKAYLSLVRRNVIGANGIKLQNDARNADGSLDKAANDSVESAWTKWGKRGECSLDGESSWLGIEKLAAQTVARDGTMLLRQYSGRSYGAFGYRVQPLEVDFLDIEMSADLPNGNVVRMGIELDGNNRRVAYHMFTRHPGEYLPGRAREKIRVPASQIICLFRPERPGQLLGVPWAYTALRRLNMLRGYEEAAITAARVGAAKMGFYVQQANAEPPVDIEGTGEQSEAGHLVREMEPGMMETLPQGWDFKPHDPAYPSGEIKSFVQVVLQGAAAGLDVSYPTLANDLSNVNFSSLRAGKGEEREEWRDVQQWIIESLHEEVFSRFLPMAFLMGQMGNLPASKLEKFMQPRWRPRGWAYVSPGEEANANQREMAAMIRSPQQIVAERGEDLETVFADIAAAKVLAEQFGLDFNPMPPGHETAAPPPDPAAGTA